MTSPINDEAANAAARVFYGRAYGSVGDEANKVLLDGAREALEAAYPAIRQQVAEQIATALEARAVEWETPWPVPEGWDSHHITVRGASQTATTNAARIAREIGSKG